MIISNAESLLQWIMQRYSTITEISVCLGNWHRP